MRTIKLQNPFIFEGEKIEAVKFKRLKGRDIRQITEEIATRHPMASKEVSGSQFTMYAVAKCVGLSIEQLDEMDAADLLPLMERVSGFLSPGESSGASA